MNEAELRQLIREVWDSSTGVSGGAGLAYSTLEEFERAVLASSVGQQAGDLDEATLRQAISNGLDVGMTMLDVASDDEAIVRAATGQEQIRDVEDFVTPFERDIYLMQLRENAEASGVTLGNSTDEIMESLGVDSDLATLLAQGRGGPILDPNILNRYGVLTSADLQEIFRLVRQTGTNPGTIANLDNMDLDTVQMLLATGNSDFDRAASLVTGGRSQQIRRVDLGGGQFQQVHEALFQTAMQLPGMDSVLVEAAIGSNFRAGGRNDMWNELAFVASQRNVAFLGTSVDDPEMVTRLRSDADEIARLVIETVEPYNTVEELNAAKADVTAAIGDENYEFAVAAVEQKQQRRGAAADPDSDTGTFFGALAAGMLKRSGKTVEDQLASAIAPELRDRYLAEGDGRRYRDIALTEMDRLAGEFRGAVDRYGGADAGGAVLAILELSGFEDLAEQAWETGQLDAEGQAALNNWVYSDGNLSALQNAGFTNLYQNSYWQTLLQGADTGSGYGVSDVVLAAEEDIEESYRTLYRSYFMTDPSDEQLAQFVQMVDGEAMGYQQNVVGEANIFKEGQKQAGQLQRQMRSTESMALEQIRESDLYERLYSGRGDTSEAQYLLDFQNAVTSTGVPLSGQTQAVYAGMETGDIGTARFRAVTSQEGRTSGSVRGGMAKIAQTISRLT